MNRRLHETCGTCGHPVDACACSDLFDPRATSDYDNSDAPTEFQGKYVTEAIESTVYDEDRQVLGHVGLVDLDDVSLNGATEVAEKLLGPAAILRSSPRSYHVWALAVEPLNAWVDLVAGIDNVDDEHVTLSTQRECSVLRLDDKINVTTGDTVKPAPVLRRLVDRPFDRQLSEPHIRVLVNQFGADLDVDALETVGSSTERRTYMAEIGGRGGDA